MEQFPLRITWKGSYKESHGTTTTGLHVCLCVCMYVSGEHDGRWNGPHHHHRRWGQMILRNDAYKASFNSGKSNKICFLMDLTGTLMQSRHARFFTSRLSLTLPHTFKPYFPTSFTWLFSKKGFQLPKSGWWLRRRRRKSMLRKTILMHLKATQRQYSK